MEVESNGMVLPNDAEMTILEHRICWSCWIMCSTADNQFPSVCLSVCVFSVNIRESCIINISRISKDPDKIVQKWCFTKIDLDISRKVFASWGTKREDRLVEIEIQTLGYLQCVLCQSRDRSKDQNTIDKNRLCLDNVRGRRFLLYQQALVTLIKRFMDSFNEHLLRRPVFSALTVYITLLCNLQNNSLQLMILFCLLVATIFNAKYWLCSF